ncbi:DMT family transporter [Sulfurospirillum sp. 1612]|uniref:DMT family transporter n=1 Tax=Sulfurospirillum sp. 1612 TaxID=3094835 RepID=UPI002F94205E
MVKKGIDWVAVGALILAMMVWASSFIALKSAIGPIGPMNVIFFRMALASVSFMFFIKKFKKISFTKRDIKFIALMTFFEPCLYFIFEAHALKNTSAAQAGMITSMMPIITAIGAGFFLKEAITRKLMIGSFLAVVGAVWLSVSSESTDQATNPLLGNTLELLAMICGAGYTIAIRHLSARFSPLFLTAIQSFMGTIFFLPFALWEYNTTTMHVSTSAILWVVYLGIFVTMFGYGMFNFALSRIEASKAAVYTNLIPVFTIILAFIILGEKFGFMEIVASCIIFSGVIISQMPGWKRKIKQRA